MFRRKATRFQGVNSPTLSGDAADEIPVSATRLRLIRAGRLLVNPLVVLGVFVIAYAALGMMYYQAYSRESEHQSAINAAQSSLAAQPDDPAALRAALAGWTSALEAADQMRVQAKFDSALLSQLMDVADSTGVSLVSAGLQSDSVSVIAENEYLSTPIRLRVNGTLEVIRDFIGQLEDGAIEALEVQRSEVTLEAGRYSAIVNVAVFSQPASLGEEKE